ncbi:hypothetical protein A5787_17210 [Mycobacterium sp. 852002-50816_SCH5313054-b]|nr:hypothetical protein A5787_17210 [Mycobacterium sp. 852002-50816_SCH5313054-b]
MGEIPEAPFRTPPCLRCLRGAPASLRQGLQSGAEENIPFFATKTRFGLWFRIAAMRTMNFAPLARFFARTVIDDFDLPDYGI